MASTLGLLAACGADPAFPRADAGPQLPPNVVGVRTVAPESTFSGRKVPIRCELVDADGEVVAWAHLREATIAIGQADVITEMPDGSYVAGMVGTTTVACTVATLTDDTPVNVMVRPGTPATVLTLVSRADVKADPDDLGTDVTCEVRDAAGNLLSNEDTTIELADPFSGTLTDANAKFTLASTQRVGCIVPGAETTWADVVVGAGRPATIYLDLTPPQAVYNPGSTVEASVVVVDSYGNPADASGLVVSSSPSATTHVAGTMTFTYATAGTFAIEARIDTGTVTGAPIVATEPVLVNDGGPTIGCSPQMVRIGANGNTWASLGVAGSVSDMNGFQRLGVDRNGDRDTTDAGEDFTPAPGTSNANYTTTVDPNFGANCYLVQATDSQGTVEERCCPFIASENYAAEIAAPTVANPGPGSISLSIPQRGVDDRATSPSINPAQSIGDVLDRGITAASLSDYLHTYFTRPGNNNFVGSGTADLCLLFCLSVPVDVYYRPDIQRIAIAAPNVNIDLIPAGLRTSLLMNQFRLGLEFRITGAPGWVNDLVAGLSEGNTWIDNLSARADWSISAQNGKFKTTLIPNSFVVNYASGDLHSQNLLVSIVAAVVPGIVREALSEVVQQVIGPIVQDLLGAITIDTFGIMVPLPKLDGTGNLSVRVSGSFTGASANASALSAVIAPYFVVSNGTPQGRPSLGVASQEAPSITPLNLTTTSPNLLTNQSLAMALHDVAVNDLVHRLWRASYFDGPLSPSALTALGIDLGPLSALLSNFSLSMSSPLPPVAELLQNGKLRIGLAGVRVALTIPGSGDPTPIELETTAVFDATTTISNGRIAVTGVTRVSLDLRAVTTPANVDANVLSAMVAVAGPLVDKIITDVLARSVAGIPVPRLVFPQTPGPISLPGPMTLAITNPVLTNYGTYPQRYLVVGGGLSEVP